MADDKKTKPKDNAKEKPAVKTKAEAKPEAAAETKADAPKNYSKGEGQKAVTQAYKDNWNAIFGKKNKR